MLLRIIYNSEKKIITYSMLRELSLMVQSGKITGIYDIGTYYFDDSTNKKNGEFDAALKIKNGYEIVEAKYFKNKVKNQSILEEIQQIKKNTEIDVVNYGFASIK